MAIRRWALGALAGLLAAGMGYGRSDLSHRARDVRGNFDRIDDLAAGTLDPRHLFRAIASDSEMDLRGSLPRNVRLFSSDPLWMENSYRVFSEVDVVVFLDLIVSKSG